MSRPRIRAYVTGEQCVGTRAFRPGEDYQGQPVSKHGDLRPWTYGKVETVLQAEFGSSPYMRRCARAVLRLFWE